MTSSSEVVFGTGTKRAEIKGQYENIKSLKDYCGENRR